MYDAKLKLEAYRFVGAVQPFTNHFHDCYIIRIVESGVRRLVCSNREYTIVKGNTVIFNPGDSHGCEQSGDDTFAYRGIYVPVNVMSDLINTSADVLPPCFSKM